MEIACSPESALTQEFVDNGFTGMRINYLNGFDLDSKKGTNLLVKEIKEKHPKLAWVSMVCTRMSSLQNLTPRTPEQQDRFLKRKGQDLRRCDDVVTGLEEVLPHGDDLAWGMAELCGCRMAFKAAFNDFKDSSSATTGRSIGSTLTGVNMDLNGMDGQSKRLGQS